MVRIQIMLNKPAGDQPKTIFPTNFKVDFKNEVLELRDMTIDDSKLLFKAIRDNDLKRVKVQEKSMYGKGIDAYLPLDIIESILTFKH